ncbi:hypothetical protein ABZ023_26065 [Streptomyces sp. NPDC006367]|uniref:hypothetical protein n=1 Tax=unclassified Streptomyces TaxID=2593676 RepID=UPI0033BF2747
MSEPTESATLYTQYTSKVEEDLAALEKEHTALVVRLAQVERDLELLRKVKAVISSGEGGSPSQPGAEVLQEEGAQSSEQMEAHTATPGEHRKTSAAPAGEQGALQAPAQKAAAKTTAKKATAKKTTAKKTTAKKTTAKKAAAKKTAENQAEPGPSRRKLILDYFAEVGQPRSSAEVTKELTQRHPEFTSSVAATREALEALVARSKLERTTQGRSVYYGPVTPTSEGAGGTDETKEKEAS